VLRTGKKLLRIVNSGKLVVKPLKLNISKVGRVVYPRLKASKNPAGVNPPFLTFEVF
jgi:hypothetical protein